MTTARLRTERGFDRLVNFSDAVVAIAITLLVLPLVELAGDTDLGAFELVTQNSLAFVAFFATFAVTTIFWITHHQLFELMAAYDGRLLWLNSLWLLWIALFPFTSELINSGGFGAGAGLLYCGNMALLSATQGLIILHVRAQPRLWALDVAATDFHPGWAWTYAGFFAAVAAFSLAQPDLASWLMFGLFPLGRLKARQTKKRPS